MPLDLIAARMVLEKLYPWRLLFWDPDVMAFRIGQKMPPFDEACEHEWHDWKPNLIRFCSRCGRVEGRRDENEHPMHFYDQIMGPPRCPLCRKPQED